MPLKKKITAIAMLAVMTIPTFAYASDYDNYNSSKKSFGITNKKSLEGINQPDVTSEHYIDGTNNMNVGLRGGELRLINNTNPTLNKAEIYDLESVYSVVQNGIITIDDNRFSGEGWALYLKATPLTEIPKEGGKEPIGGWKVGGEGHITYEGITAIKDVTGALSHEGTYAETAPIGVNYSKPTPIDNVKIKVAYALKNKGVGVWVLDDIMENIKITLGDNIKPDKENYPNSVTPYVTTFEWTLVSGPGIQ